MVEKKVAIMQPYIFPYLGYFQLIHAVDTFIFYDDVNFIKQGWINRNQLLFNNKATFFTVPIKKISSFEEIRNTQINYNNYNIWSKKFLKSIEQNYRKAPFFDDVYKMIKDILDRKYGSISSMAISSIKEVNTYLGLDKTYFNSAQSFPNTKNLEKADRIIKICNEFNCKKYINPSGGKKLYNKKYFSDRGISLFFIENNLPEYDQGTEQFIPGLSIIDVLMRNSTEDVLKMLGSFVLK